MCSRYTITALREEWEELFGTAFLGFLPRYNVAPTQSVPTVCAVGSGPPMMQMRDWGFMARTGNLLVNAKSETVAELPTFKDAYRERRCLIPADGFIEWETVAGKKRPYWFRRAAGKPFAFAGLWEGDRCTILTTAANDMVSDIHDRMPVILTPEHFAGWLDRQSAESDLRKLMGPYAGPMQRVGVNPRINSFRNEDAALLQPFSFGLFDDF